MWLRARASLWEAMLQRLLRKPERLLRRGSRKGTSSRWAMFPWDLKRSLRRSTPSLHPYSSPSPSADLVYRILSRHSRANQKRSSRRVLFRSGNRRHLAQMSATQQRRRTLRPAHAAQASSRPPDPSSRNLHRRRLIPRPLRPPRIATTSSPRRTRSPSPQRWPSEWV